MPAPVLIDWFEKDYFSFSELGLSGADLSGEIVCPVYDGEVPEWPKGTDCKSVGSAFGGSNPPLPILSFEVG